MTHDQILWGVAAILAVGGINMVSQLFWDYWRNRARAEKEHREQFVGRHEHRQCTEHTRLELVELREGLHNFQVANEKGHIRLYEKIDDTAKRAQTQMDEVMRSLNGRK